jgi:carbon storage regulator CsrA
MLVLTRKLQQQIKIGDEITVTILKLKGNTVRIGIDAPKAIRVVRGELPAENAEESHACDSALPTASESAETIPTGLQVELAPQSPEPQVIAFRVRRTDESVDVLPAETPTQVPAGQLPLRHVRDRFGAGPLKQLVAASAAATR